MGPCESINTCRVYSFVAQNNTETIRIILNLHKINSKFTINYSEECIGSNTRAETEGNMCSSQIESRLRSNKMNAKRHCVFARITALQLKLIRCDVVEHNMINKLLAFRASAAE